jgi:hypothetical protein
VPADQIHLGGPPRDGIPSIDRPRFVAAQDADFISDTDRDSFAGRQLTIRFDPAAESARVFDENGAEVTAVTGFCFAWYAFHPETEVYTAGKRR